MITASTRFAAAIAAAAFACSAGGAAIARLDQGSLRAAVQQYLREKGDFCLGKFNWPIAVSERDRQVGTNDAIQMPVLEKLGLVTSSAVPGNPAATQYDLTAEGRKYYLARKTVTLGPGGKPSDHPGDFCPAHLKLDRVVRWEPAAAADGHAHTTVSFTYGLESAADWTRDADIQRVFPMLHRIVEGAGRLQLTQVFEWSKEAWVPVAPGT